MSDHLDELLSALLDGELAADEEAAARAHLDECDECSRALHEIEIARRVLRGLPAVDAPADVGIRIVARRRRLIRRGVLSASGSAVVLLVVVVVSAPSPRSPVEPRVGSMAQVHLAHQVGAPDLVRAIAPSSSAPSQQRLSMNGGMVSVFTEDGHLDDDWHDDAPQVDVGERTALVTSDAPAVVVVEANDSVLTAVASDVRLAVEALERLIGTDGRTIAERAHDACVDLVGAFGFSP